MALPNDLKTKLSIDDDIASSPKEALSWASASMIALRNKNLKRLTLLLGPPASGKTTLLLALAGKLDSDLKVSGSITYNGHDMEEFMPQRTSAYISQYDVHIGKMTVRETLAFSAGCQGVGAGYDAFRQPNKL